jgi:hypothetical protein
VPPEADLKDFAFTPIYRARLFGSAFHARASDAEWRAGVTLWLKCQDQSPAGSLPKDDVELCRLAEFGRDMKSWKKVKAMALHGWHECSDGRLYHSVCSETAAEQWQSKIAHSRQTLMARIAKAEKRLKTETDQTRRQEIEQQVAEMRQKLSSIPQQGASLPAGSSAAGSVTDGATVSVTDVPTGPAAGLETGLNSKGQGQGQGSLEEDQKAAPSGGEPPGEPAITTPLDLKAEVWRIGKAFLAKCGVEPKPAGELIGKWRRDHGDLAVINALASAQAEVAQEPIAFITACLKAKQKNGDHDGRTARQREIDARRAQQGDAFRAALDRGMEPGE